MKTSAILLTLALAALVPATALAATAAPSATGSCDTLPKTALQCALWALKCIGDALGGNACHSDAALSAQEGPKELVQCTVGQVENVLQGVTPMPCVLDAQAGVSGTGPDPEKVVACAAGAVRAVLGGYTPMPCTVN